jgi:hypothetical protein
MLPRRPIALLATSVVVALGAATAACSKAEVTGPLAPASTVAPSYATVEDLAAKLQAAGITCQLEYQGLKQEDKTLSICVVDGEQATLTIWDRPADVTAFLASTDSGTGATAVGANWTIDVDTAATAQKLVGALGGQVKAPQTPGTTAP